MSKQVVKNTKVNNLDTKVNKLENKVPNVTTLVHVNQYNTGKKNSEKKIEMLIKSSLDTSGLVATTVLNTKIYYYS